MESQASTTDNITYTNLSFMKHCKHCLLINDLLIELTTIAKGRTNYLYCNNCKQTYCESCSNKVTIRKNGYPICYKCYRHQKNLFLEPKSKPDKGLVLCTFDRCGKTADYETFIYNPKNDKMKTGLFCKKHYMQFYYYVKLKTSRSNRLSFGKKKHSRKSIIKTSLLYNKNGRNKEIQKSINSP